MQAVTAHFEESSYVDESELKRKFEVNRERVLARVARYIHAGHPQGSILDVGCATGLFLDRFFGDGAWETCGVDLSAAAAEQARNKGIRVHRGDIVGAHFMPNSFDVITVLDAFYYFPKPQVELAEFMRILKPGGLLVLELPLAASRIWRTSGKLGKILNWGGRPLLQSSDHLFYYGPTAISTLFNKCGYRVEAILPLPGNRQPGMLRDLAFRGYFAVSRLLMASSRGRIFMGPRFLVTARKTGSLQSKRCR
jgi:SAM-dependent methyltransferase